MENCFLYATPTLFGMRKYKLINDNLKITIDYVFNPKFGFIFI